jgi:aryl sulfotransferase
MNSANPTAEKIREFHNHHFDSTIWNELGFRDDDMVIATYAKSGTTWTQQMVGQMLFGGDPDLAVAEMSPWLDLRIPPKEVNGLPQLDQRPASRQHEPGPRFFETWGILR